MTKLYLTFDDGPNTGTRNIYNAFDGRGKASIFLVAGHVRSNSDRQFLDQLHENDGFDVCNHSTSHANGHYRAYYRDPERVVSGFEQANEVLGLGDTSPILARLPGRNTWRLNGISVDDYSTAGDTREAANRLRALNYRIFGWDIEWAMQGGRLRYDAAEFVRRLEVYAANRDGRVSGHIIMLAHDIAFRRGDAAELERLLDLLDERDFDLELISNYPR